MCIIGGEGRRPGMKRSGTAKLLAVLCAAVMLLATVAVAAANRWGVLDFFGNSAKPLIAADGCYLRADLIVSPFFALFRTKARPGRAGENA